MSSEVYFSDMHVRMGDSILEKFRRLIIKAGIDQIDFRDKFVAVKLHFGEVGNMAFLRHQYARVLCDHIKERGGKPFLTDCNTLYVGYRNNALNHLEAAYMNGYNPLSTGVHTIIADGLRGTDERLIPVEGGEYVQEAKIGAAVAEADVIISLTPFQGSCECRIRRRPEKYWYGLRLEKRKDGDAQQRNAEDFHWTLHWLRDVCEKLCQRRCPCD